MVLVLIHIGDTLPKYIYDTLEQSRKFFSGDIYMVKSMYITMSNDFNIKYVDYEELLDYHRVKDFNSSNRVLSQGFWSFTCLRFMVLEALINAYNLENIFHIENDVVIYNDLENLANYITKFKNSFVINPIGPIHSSGAFVYISNLNAISFLNSKIIELLQKIDYVKDRIKDTFVSEMNLLTLVNQDYPDIVKTFPILPYGEFSDSSTELIFDSATWGQVAGGHPPHDLLHHWIGREMYPERKFKYLWEVDSNGRRCPFIIDKKGNKYKFNNLHIHCKRIREFI